MKLKMRSRSSTGQPNRDGTAAGAAGMMPGRGQLDERADNGGDVVSDPSAFALEMRGIAKPNSLLLGWNR